MLQEKEFPFWVTLGKVKLKQSKTKQKIKHAVVKKDNLLEFRVMLSISQTTGQHF